MMTDTGAIDADAACRMFRPIIWSSRDTDETIAEVKAHNAAWEAVCGSAPLHKTVKTD